MNNNKTPLVYRHYLDYKLVAIYGAVHLGFMVIASIMFFKIIAGKFSHIIFWPWCIWSFITAYTCYLFLRTIFTPAVQVYLDQVYLLYPKERTVAKQDILDFKSEEHKFTITFMEKGTKNTVTVPIRQKRAEEILV